MLSGGSVDMITHLLCALIGQSADKSSRNLMVDLRKDALRSRTLDKPQLV